MCVTSRGLPLGSEKVTGRSSISLLKKVVEELTQDHTEQASDSATTCLQVSYVLTSPLPCLYVT